MNKPMTHPLGQRQGVHTFEHEHHAGLDALHYALSLKRPHGGKGVKHLASFIIKRLVERGHQTLIDQAGNIHVDLRRNAMHKTLFVAHLDTVHRQDGPNRFSVVDHVIHARGQEPLGADDGAGVGVLMHLIAHGTAGYYIFSQGEEVGGIGAKFIRKHHEALLAEFDRAIAFDRRDTVSVISHQGMSRCCSDVFAQALVDQLNDLGMLYMPDDTGSYTDTAEFCDVVAECTNVSVGYFREHSALESLDLQHFKALCAAVLQITWDSLPTQRDPSVQEDLWGFGPWGWHEEDDAFERSIHQAISNALRGSCTPLTDLLCDLYPRDQRLIAKKLLLRRRIPQDVLERARDMLDYGYGDAYDALYFIADEMQAMMNA